MNLLDKLISGALKHMPYCYDCNSKAVAFYCTSCKVAFCDSCFQRHAQLFPESMSWDNRGRAYCTHCIRCGGETMRRR